MNEKRKQLLVRREFQYQAIAVSVTGFFLAVNIVLIAAMLILGPSALGAHDLLSLIVLIVLELVVAGLVSYFSLKESHRIAGPILQFERALGRIAEGDLGTTMRLRKTDHFHSTATEFNEALASLRERLELVRADAAAASGGNVDAAKRALAAIEGLLHKDQAGGEGK